MKNLLIDLGAYFGGFLISIAFYWLVSIVKKDGKVTIENTKSFWFSIDEYVYFGLIVGACSFFALSYGVDLLVSFKLIDKVSIPDESYIHAFITGLLVIKVTQILIKLVK